MAIFETFSKRRNRLSASGNKDIYQYDEFPQPFRVQVIHIWNSAIGPFQDDPPRHASNPNCNWCWKTINETLSRELGVFALSPDRFENPFVQCQRFVLNGSPDDVLNIIELSFRVIDRHVRKADRDTARQCNITQLSSDAIEELNQRFREHLIGFKYESGQLVRIDSQYIHAETVKPALKLLTDANFKGALDEFLIAHDHYRHERYKEAISESLKAFESTLKSICDRRKWICPDRATAKVLLDVVLQNSLIPLDLLSHFSGLRAALEAGVPMIRNRMSGHGQGDVVVPIPPHIASFALHLTASNIVFLISAYNAIP